MEYIGIDVAKNTFEVAFPVKKDKYKVIQYSNDEKGVRKFIKKIKEGQQSVLEATGSYSTRLTKRIMESGFKVSVINPLQIKHFSRMTFTRAKTDVTDAILIAEYGMKMTPEPTKSSPEYIEDLSQRRAVLKKLKESLTAFKNQLHALKSKVRPDKTSIRIVEDMINNLEEQIKELEENMKELTQEKSGKSFEILTSIPGIGKISAVELITITGNFENFTNYKQLAAYVGVSPRVFESGTSVKGKGSISKMGMSYTRQILYMCSLSAIRFNKACKEMYDRLIKNGKNHMVALMAVVNKLIKIIFTIVKRGELYNDKKSCFTWLF